MSATSNRRTQKVIDPQFQFGLMLFSLLSGGVAVLIHGLLLTRAMSRLAVEERSGEEILAAVPGIVVTDSLVTLGLLLPIVLFFGRSLTLRVAGPIYRFRIYLRSVAAGTETQACRVRKNDLFQDVAELITQATEAQRELNASAVSAVVEPDSAPGTSDEAADADDARHAA